MSSTEANVDAVRRLHEALNTHDENVFIEAVDDLMIPGITIHGEANRPFMIGREGFKQAISLMRSVFPDSTATIQVIFAEGSKVMWREEVQATHASEWMGVPATHKKIMWTASSIVRFNDEGKMVERWAMQDQLTARQQIGIVPRIPGQAGYVE
jgi:predicted ester cyclase